MTGVQTCALPIYEPGDQLYCVPYAPTDLRDGDLVIAQDDKQVWIRRYQRRGEFVALKHRFNFDLPRVYFPEDLKLLYGVVG